MQKITSSLELKDAIRQLEYKQSMEEQLLKEQFYIARESLAPANLIKSTFNEVFTARSLIRTVLSATVGLTAGYFTKRYFTGIPGIILKRLLGRFF